ncbi:MAG: serine/threonine-protein kinase, partial [Myxococcota bacterium]
QPKPIPEPEMNHNAPHPTHQEAPMSTDSFPRSDTNPNAQALSSGDSGAFERMEVIGSGGIGTVYHGRQTRLVREVAIKEIRDIFHVFADVQREDIISRFVDIVQTQSKLNHANIIQLLDVIPDAEYPFVVMEYAPNGNLRRLIETEGHPPLKIAMRYFLQALHALNTAHDKGITHGGIKPENVVLDASGNAKLTDFGIYGVVQRAHSTGNQVYIGVGTVAYMSPEQFRDPSISTVRSDIYSLGIMFYEMLTGKVPGRRSPMPSSFYPDIPRKLDDIFDRMSMDSEDDRFESIDEIFRELYNSAEVMNILDKRSGVLFLRDPFVHGFSGLGAEADAATETPAYDEALDEHRDAGAGLGAPADSSTLTGDQSTAGEGMADEASNTAEGFAAPARDIAGEVEELIDEDADVLDKLHKYSSLFDDHSEEES